MSFTAGALAPLSLAGFRHEALLCRGEAERARGIRTFVEEGVANGQPVLLVVPSERMDQLAGLSVVDYRDVRAIGRNPARLIPLVLDYYSNVHSQRGVRVVIEPLWPGRTCAEVEEVVMHEALVNLALEDRHISMLCVYHALDLAAGVSSQIDACHPTDGRRDLEHWTDWMEKPLAPAPADAQVVEVDRSSLPSIRYVLRRRAIAEGFRPDRAADLVLAANEVATNSIVHGDGSRAMHLWSERTDLVCEFEDGGWMSDPLAGRRPPVADSLGQRGLWLVHQLCDLVQVRSRKGCTAVRLRMACNSL